LAITLTIQVSLVLMNQSPAERRADWERELEALVPRVAAEIAVPKSERFRGDPEYYEYRRWLKLASVWPRPEFKESLLSILRGEDLKLIPQAAIGLSNYDDVAIVERVKELCADARPMHFSSCLVGTLGSRVSVELDFYRKREHSLPEAMKRLLEGDSSGQVVAFRSLIRSGVVLDTVPMTANWTTMAISDRFEILTNVEEIFHGVERMRRALEGVMECYDTGRDESEEYARLLKALANLQSTRARSAILDLIRRLQASGPMTRMRCRALEWAVESFPRVMQPEEDLSTALFWLQHKDDAMRAAGIYLLAHLDSPVALEPVQAYFERYDGKDRASYWRSVSIVAALSKRSWHDESYKWEYLRILSARLKVMTSGGEMSSCPEGHAAISLIRAMEHIAEVSLGPDGFINPGGFNRSTAASTALAWERWIAERQPANSE